MKAGTLGGGKRVVGLDDAGVRGGKRGGPGGGGDVLTGLLGG